MVTGSPEIGKMPHITLLLLLLFHTFFISAQSQSNRVLLPGFPIQTEYTGEIVPRRLFDNFSACTASDTCGECFGLGYVLCDDGGCFNPDDGEQCCKGGAMCVGRDDSCCEDVCYVYLRTLPYPLYVYWY